MENWTKLSKNYQQILLNKLSVIKSIFNSGNITCIVVVSGCQVTFNLLVSIASTATVKGGNGAAKHTRGIIY